MPKILQKIYKICYNNGGKMDIKQELEKIKKFLESEKIGNVCIEKRPNGTIIINLTETWKYQK